ncbi:MAG: molybdenum cofactor guanylyltransferase MobA [Proteobacteria bacterium]|nr:molybdenum cofactor guanylyltransferase MobA [Pseudomonadota bacterium]
MSKPLGVILAGGLSSRMGGGDKPLKMVAGQSILARVIARLGPQCDGLILNANGDPARFAAFALPVAADSIDGFAGPLAGILAGLDWAANHRPYVTDILSLPADCPFLPVDLTARLIAVRRAADVPLAAAASGGWTHPVIGLWPITLREQLRAALLNGERKIDRFTPKIGIAHAEWPVDPFDPFFNANTPEDVEAANALAVRFPSA